MKHVEAGSFIRTKSGDYAVVTEYGTFNHDTNGYYDAYLCDSGEALHIDKNEWVAIIDLHFVEVEIAEQLEYPNS